MYYIDMIKELRKSKGYSQKDMAEILSTTQQQYSKYEKQVHELPVRHLITICNHFGVSSDKILGIQSNITDTSQEDPEASERAFYIG